VPLARAFQPQLILVSSGYDPQKGDPLGGLGFSETAFQWMAARLLTLAQETGAAGPLCFLEGGYVPHMVAASIVATLKGLAGDSPPFEPAVSDGERKDVLAALENVRPYWEVAL
jgi:acetoin utilization deacetylase AcuC-like enzyme